jgi:hypothetical protein
MKPIRPIKPITQTPGCFIVFIVLVVAAAGGCASKKPPPSKPSPQPATPQQVQAVREAYSRAYPDSRVGVVIATRKPDRLVAVGELNPGEFREGQTVVFVDGQQRKLTTGSVVRVLSDSVHVAYDKPEAGGREPGVGDLMVKLPFGATTL